MLLARRTGTGLVCHASTATPIHSRGECCLRDGLAQDLFVTQARPHRFIHVVNVACETDWHRTCSSRKHGHTGSFTWLMLLARRTGTGLLCHASTATPVHSRGECCLRDGLAQDLFVTQARPHRFIHVVASNNHHVNEPVWPCLRDNKSCANPSRKQHSPRE